MTVIAYDSKMLAADKMAMYGDTLATATKIKKITNGAIVAFTGNLDLGLALTRWYEQGADPNKWPEFQKDKDMRQVLIVATKFGTFFYETIPEAIYVEDPIKAWGIGREAALGAMEMGADAKRAVEVASKWVYGCGRGCDWFYI